MIRMVEMECPNCGATLKRVNRDTCKCNYCNAYFLIDRQADQVIVVQKETQPDNNLSAVLTLFVIFACCMFAIIGMLLYSESQPHTVEPKVTPAPTIEPRLIQSAYFTSFVEQVFNKSVEEITKADLDQVIELKLRDKREKQMVDYRMQGEEMQTIEIKDAGGDRMHDLRNFRNLESLDVGYRQINANDIDGLNKLSRVVCDNSPKQLEDAISNPSEIKELQLDFGAESLEGIETFTNLEGLTIKNNELKEIEQLSSLQNLKRLKLETNSLVDFSTLFSLTNLEELSIDAEGLKDIAFVGKMDRLISLELIDTKVYDISEFAKLSQLKALTMDRNFEIEDYSAIGELAGLESLYLYCKTSRHCPNLDGLENLKELTIQGIDKLGVIQKLNQIEKLNIKGCSDMDLSCLSGFSQLRELKLNSSYGQVNHFETLANLPQLEILDMNGAAILSDCTWIFQIPTMKELNINHARIGLTVDNLVPNESLQKLYMNDVTFMKNIKVYKVDFIMMTDYDTLVYDDYKELFSNLPNIEELYLRENKVDSVAFVEHMPKLKVLDITENYVKDISPLELLEKLEVLGCEDNPIVQGKGLMERFSSVEDEQW